MCVSFVLGASVSARKMKEKINEQTEYQIVHSPHTVFDMDPCEKVNMPTFDAFELTHDSPHSV